jgi:hypothetical protein
MIVRFDNGYYDTKTFLPISKIRIFFHIAMRRKIYSPQAWKESVQDESNFLGIRKEKNVSV